MFALAKLKLMLVTVFTSGIVTTAFAEGTEAVGEKATLAEGVTYLVPGLIVVMSLLILLALSVEFISWLDNFLTAREQAKIENEEAVSVVQETAAPAEEVKEDYSSEIATAIALALHQHFTARRQSMATGVGRRRGTVSWSTSGRLEIMTSRQGFSSRPKHVKQS